MNYILRDEKYNIVDVFECKQELLNYTILFLDKHNKTMKENGENENIIEMSIETVGDCITVFYGFGYSIEMR